VYLGRKDVDMKILMVLTSHDTLGDTGRKTGFWLEEFAAPYFVFRDAGVELTLASQRSSRRFRTGSPSPSSMAVS
jgi:putative intracellular protease/amidase